MDRIDDKSFRSVAAEAKSRSSAVDRLDVKALYQQTVMAHHRCPRNHGELGEATHRARGTNRFCGDEINIAFKLGSAGVIDSIRFIGHGCAISRASASLLTEAAAGRDEAQIRALVAQMKALVEDDAAPPAELLEQLGTLAVLRVVRSYPARKGCALLAWHVLEAALDGKEQA